MATKKFIQGMDLKTGAATAQAQREGLSVQAWAQKHQNDPGVTGKRARLAITFNKMAQSRKKAVTKRLKSG